MSQAKIKKVSFDWKEISKNDSASLFRITCKLTLDGTGMEVEGTAFTYINKVAMNSFSVPLEAEQSAFDNAAGRAAYLMSISIHPRN
ncbi:hypothetical protein [Enterobacter sp. BNK-34]|uniref:hypothetical protein n=1 Tax=Enterobacter sp. BNK-34 TaxID=3376171 RepID=UPI003B4372C0